MVRRLVGNERYSSKETLVQLNRVYQLVRCYGNFFQPVMQLQRKSRHGAKVHKVYDAGKTPYRRLLESGVLAYGDQKALAAQYERLNPVRLLGQINKELEKLWTMANTTSSHQSPVTLAFDATMAVG